MEADHLATGQGAGGADACRGDSGGPLLAADSVQVGARRRAGACLLPRSRLFRCFLGLLAWP
jgi:hypothetical protein